MNRNTNANHFDLAPSVGIERSRFKRNSGLKTSANIGTLFVTYCDEVLPGDTWEMKTSQVSRLQTLKTPVYDNLYLDTYFFFVPNRLIWEHWVNLMGENSDSPWIPENVYTTPQVTSPDVTGWSVGSLADYFGLPTGVPGLSVNALPFRAYAKIVQDWFIDQNIQQPVNIPINDSTVAGSNGDNYVTDLVKGGMPFIACKLHDYFTSCLPGPQKGPDVQIPLSSFPSNQLPVYAIGAVNDYYAPSTGTTLGDTVASSYPLAFASSSQPQVNGKDVPSIMTAGSQYFPDGGAWTGNTIYQDSSDHPYLRSTDGSGNGYFSATNTNEKLEENLMYGLTPVNLVAGGAAGDLYMATINSLRTAFQIQRMLEVDARSGSRYVECIAAHFKVNAGDARMQRSEYLGGKRCPLNISQVTQLGATNETSPLGDVAGMSVTADVNHDFVKSFTEHGFIIGLAVARYEHSYQQGLERFWSRSDRFSYYWPTLAHLGEQPVYVKEIYATGDPTNDELVFGFQEAWCEYRTKFSKITGELRSSYSASLDIWHFGDDYDSRPSLSSSWIVEDKANVDRTLAVTSAVSNQMFSDFWFETFVTRPMPLYSIPGLIDHF